MRLRRRVWWAVLALPAAWLAAAGWLDGYGLSQVPGRGPFDAIVVAGCRVLPNGTASRALRRRTMQAVDLWRQGLAPTLVLTGGVGANPPSEARAAAAVAIALGVPEADIVLEERSTTTAENARFAAALTPARRVLVVTDSYHVLRCRVLFAQSFDSVRAVGSAPTPYYRAKGALREVAVWIYSAATGQLRG